MPEVKEVLAKYQGNHRRASIPKEHSVFDIPVGRIPIETTNTTDSDPLTELYNRASFNPQEAAEILFHKNQ